MSRSRSSSKSQRKPRAARVLRKRILVVTEGKLTEPQYVESLQAHLRSADSTTIVRTVGVGKDPVSVVREALRLRDQRGGYDVCVALVDVDSHARLAEACALACHHNVLLLISRVKFEVWLRWHVEGKTSPLNSGQLDRLMREHNVLDGKRLHPAFPIEYVAQACATARRAWPELRAGAVGPDPSSALPLLVELMQ